ncbi:RIIa domain-containing protein 1 isoform X1 [Girardinichthys multiradiatus]|uniref:RIIa domain-containing protein 1 isoform X1 n=1 Tax=Girardinichthys multiradiatus TaxID=208333 RepID=UPI001FAC7D89|nr:RIIa domain-containing protein 1 isoform X1 [Girardinichthys multiradiatus]
MEEAGKDFLTKPTVSILSSEQQEKLRQFKIQTRNNNEKYLRAHPEVEEIVGEFLSSSSLTIFPLQEGATAKHRARNLLIKRPSDIREFAADHFASLNVPSGSVIKGNRDMD